MSSQNELSFAQNAAFQPAEVVGKDVQERTSGHSSAMAVGATLVAGLALTAHPDSRAVSGWRLRRCVGMAAVS
jgi:hypothetical protein